MEPEVEEGIGLVITQVAERVLDLLVHNVNVFLWKGEVVYLEGEKYRVKKRVTEKKRGIMFLFIEREKEDRQTDTHTDRQKGTRDREWQTKREREREIAIDKDE